jgi:transposase
VCEGAVVQAPAPERPIDGGLATEGKRCGGRALRRGAAL